MTQFTDQRQIDTGFTFNGFGDVVQETSADRGIISYAYDTRGLVSSMTDGNGVVSTYQYDDGGRLTARRFASDPSQDQEFRYDYTNNNSQGENKIDRIDDASGFTHRRYKDGGYVSLDRRNIEGKTYSTAYSTDTKGRLFKYKTPDKLEVKISFDTQDRVKEITAQRRVKIPGTNQYPAAVTVLRNATYMPFGPVASYEMGDGGAHVRNFDSSYRLTGMTDTLGTTDLRDVTYAWTARDNLSIVSDALNPLNTETFQYTAREFLAEAVGGYGEIDYTYDAVGNRSSRTLYQAGTTATDLYTYPATSNRLQSIAFGAPGTRSLVYDAAGNVTYDDRSGQGFGYTYNAAGRMESFSIAGVVQEEYLYNAMGQQVVRRMTQAGKTIHVVHDLDGNRLAEYEIDNATGTRTLLQEYIWFNGVPVAVVDGQTDEVFFVRTDHIGRPVFATDINGVKVWEASYLPFGGVHVPTTGALNLRFPGQWFHAESGLHQNWMRDYDPTSGRYMQADPLGLVDGASVYGYALQNPGRYVDPRGEESSGGQGTTKVPGTGYNVRVDRPTHPNQQRHAHIYDRKMCPKCVVNQDGTPSHGTDQSKVNKVLKNKKLRRFLTSKGFRLMGHMGLLLECLPNPAETRREMECRQNPFACLREEI